MSKHYNPVMMIQFKQQLFNACARNKFNLNRNEVFLVEVNAEIVQGMQRKGNLSATIKSPAQEDAHLITGSCPWKVI